MVTRLVYHKFSEHMVVWHVVCSVDKQVLEYKYPFNRLYRSFPFFLIALMRDTQSTEGVASSMDYKKSAYVAANTMR